MKVTSAKKKLFVELIKPSHYDDDGYVIQWWKSWIPSNTLACLYGLTCDIAERRALGDDVEIVINAYDEFNTVIPIKEIIHRLKNSGGRGIVFLVGVQSNQFPRAMDIAGQFLDENIQVAIGGFHVSGCIAMLPELPGELIEAGKKGITFFAGEAENGRLADVYADAYNNCMKPVYNFLGDLPGLEGQVTPFLPNQAARRIVSMMGCFDAGRGCSFQCSFCTVINVQGRKSRYRTADDVEALIRSNFSRDIKKFFITDDNFARNKNWEAIFDRMIDLRENHGFRSMSLTIQVDALSYKIPNFVSKAAKAGCTKVIIGLENINPENLAAVKKSQNRITEYKKMFQTWRSARIITFAGYILGFPADTPETIERDIEIIKRELPVDLLGFFCLTPLPGSEDHKNLHMKGIWMEPDLNNYDLEHVTTMHPNMSKEQWEGVYRNAWHMYYSPEHIETLLRRSAAGGANTSRLMLHIFQFYSTFKYQSIHPLQGGFFRRKIRTQRRPTMHHENRLIFYPRRVWETVSTIIQLSFYYVKLRSMRKRIKRDPMRYLYTDDALAPVEDTEEESLEKESSTSV